MLYAHTGVYFGTYAGLFHCLSCFLLCFDLDQFVGQFIAVLGTAAAFNGPVVINHLAAATPRPCICTYCRQTYPHVGNAGSSL